MMRRFAFPAAAHAARSLSARSGLRAASTLPKVVHTPPPRPDWRPPEKLPMPAELGSRFLQFDPSELKSCYSMMTTAILPRPIAFVSTCGGPGMDNLAPYSYFNLVCHQPPTIAIGIMRHGRGPREKKDTWANIEATGEFTVNRLQVILTSMHEKDTWANIEDTGELTKDTWANIEATGEFTVNIISEWFIEAANWTSGLYPPETSEWAESGLTPLPSVKVRPPRVAESAFQMECVLRHHYDVSDSSGKVTCTVVIGECVLLHAIEGLVGEPPRPGHAPELKLEGYHPMARLGGDSYSRVSSVFDLKRPALKRV